MFKPASQSTRDSGIEAGTVQFPSFKIHIPDGAVESWHAWFEAFVIDGQDGRDAEKEGTLTLGSPHQQPLATIKLHGLGIYAMAHDARSADEGHRVEMYCHSMEFEPGT